MNLSNKSGAILVGATNLLAACGAFVIWGIYMTFAQWGADGFIYWSELALIGVATIILFVCAGSAWWKRHSSAFALTSSACSIVVLILAFLVLVPTIHSRRGSAGFAENMVWLIAPIVLLLIGLFVSSFRFLQLKSPEGTS